MNVTEKWLDGLELGQAWFLLAEPENKDEFRKAGKNCQRSAYFRDLMRRELIHRIIEREILCAGMRVNPIPSDEPEVIPAHLFSKANIDWETSTLCSFKHIFEGVRIISTEGLPPKELKRAKKRRGRRPVGAKIEQVVRDLDRQRLFAGKLEKERVALVQEHCRRIYPTEFPKPTQPSRTKVREILKRVGI